VIAETELGVNNHVIEAFDAAALRAAGRVCPALGERPLHRRQMVGSISGSNNVGGIATIEGRSARQVRPTNRLFCVPSGARVPMTAWTPATASLAAMRRPALPLDVQAARARAAGDWSFIW